MPMPVVYRKRKTLPVVRHAAQPIETRPLTLPSDIAEAVAEHEAQIEILEPVVFVVVRLAQAPSRAVSASLPLPGDLHHRLPSEPHEVEEGFLVEALIVGVGAAAVAIFFIDHRAGAVGLDAASAEL